MWQRFAIQQNPLGQSAMDMGLPTPPQTFKKMEFGNQAKLPRTLQ
jgi:hypothetical protein